MEREEGRGWEEIDVDRNEILGLCSRRVRVWSRRMRVWSR